MANRYGISVPQRNVNSLQRTTAQLKEAVEAILGYRGSLYAGINLSGGSIAPNPSPPDFEGLLEYLETVETRLVDHESRIADLEYNQSQIIEAINWLADGTHAFGYSASRYRHTPANNPANTNTRLTFDTTTALSNVDQAGDYGFSPQYEGDYHIIVYLNFEADSSGDEWRMQAYDQGTPLGDVFEFKPDEVGGGVFAQFTLQTAGYFHVGDVIDLRLWPNDSGKGGWIDSYSYQFTGLGLVDPDWQPIV